MHTTVTSKGQVTLPKALRDKLHLSAGDRIEFVIDDDDGARMVVKRTSVTRLKGLLPPPEHAVSLEEMERAIQAGVRDS